MECILSKTKEKMMPTKDIRAQKKGTHSVPFFAYKEKVHMKQAIMSGCPAPAHPATIPPGPPVEAAPEGPHSPRKASSGHRISLCRYVRPAAAGHPACRY